MGEKNSNSCAIRGFMIAFIRNEFLHKEKPMSTMSLIVLPITNCGGVIHLDHLVNLDTAITDPEITQTPKVAFFYLPEKAQARFVKFVRSDRQCITGYAIQELNRQYLNKEALAPLIETNRIVWMDTENRIFHFHEALKQLYLDKHSQLKGAYIKRDKLYYGGIECTENNELKTSGKIAAFVNAETYAARTKELLAIAESMKKEEAANSPSEKKSSAAQQKQEQGCECVIQ